jgi:hypothetical protein
MKKQKVTTLDILLLLLGLALIVSSCSDFCGDSVCGSGSILSEIREVAYFDSIEIRVCCQVLFEKGVQQELIVEAEQNILPLIKTWVRNDGTLIVESERSYDSRRGVTVYASLLEIRSFVIVGAGKVIGQQPFSTGELTLRLDGAGTIEMNVNAENVYSTINGTGHIGLSGSADFHNVKINGAGILDALDFVTSVYELTIIGAGYCHIHVTDVLDVVLAGAGIVFYRGTPEVINSQISGAGKLVKL